MAVTVWTSNRRLEKAVRDALAPVKIECFIPRVKTLPRTADAVVTIGSLNSRVEFLAYRMGTGLPFVLPQAIGALVKFTANVPDAVLVGADCAELQR